MDHPAYQAKQHVTPLDREYDTPKTFPTPAHPNAKFPKLLVVLILLFIAVGIVFGVSKVLQSPKPDRQKAQTPQISPSTKSDPTADWKTYANTKYEYSLSYPGTWNLDSQNDSVMLSSSDYKSEEIEGISAITEGAKITIDTRESEYENTELLKEYYDSTEVIGYQNGFVLTSLGGLEAIRSSCGHYVPGVCYEIISDKTHYTIRYSPARKNVYIEEFDQILQTFKFAESNLMLGKPPSKNCDLNEDEVCNLQDETLINAAMGSRRGDNNYNPLADVDADGSVTIDDKKMLFPVTMPAR